MKSTAVLRHSSSFKVANTTSIHHFSFLLWLDLVRFHSRKPIFRGTLMKNLRRQILFVFISYLSDMDVMDLYYTIPLGMSTIIF